MGHGGRGSQYIWSVAGLLNITQAVELALLIQLLRVFRTECLNRALYSQQSLMMEEHFLLIKYTWTGRKGWQREMG